MSKKSKIYHEPSTLNEWTLEMNINHEIMSMFSDFFLGNYPYYLRRVIFRLPMVAPLHPFRKKGFAYKLTPGEEGAGGGWDGKIVIPKGMGAESRIIFIQYKRGYHSDGNNDCNSLFDTSKKNPNKHIEFSFNSNNNKNQHQFLKNLANDLILKGKSDEIVMYGFPRLTTKEQFESLSGNLLLYTTFLTLSQMDKEATNSKVNLYDNKAHLFRSCYKDANKREICSTPFQLQFNDKSNDVLFEIIACRIGSFWNNSIEETQYLSRIKNEIKLMVADYLKINPFIEYSDELKDYKDLYENGYLNYFKENAINRNNLERELFLDQADEINYLQNNRTILFSRLNSFINELGANKIDISRQIPAIYTQPIEDGFNLDLESGQTDATLSYIII